MNEEEKKAIEKLRTKTEKSTWYDTIRQIKREEITDVVVTRQKYLDIVLNLIETQSKMINLMLEDLPTSDYHSKEWVKAYYEKESMEYRVETEEKK